MLKLIVGSIGLPIPGVKFKLFKYENSDSYQLGVKGKNIMNCSTSFILPLLV